MPRIAVVDQIHEDGIKLLKKKRKYNYEIIKNLSKKKFNFKTT